MKCSDFFCCKVGPTQGQKTNEIFRFFCCKVGPILGENKHEMFRFICCKVYTGIAGLEIIVGAGNPGLS